MSSPLADSPQQRSETDPNARRRHFRRIPSSQRSHSPPPDRKPICTVIKSVLCLPIYRKRKPSEEQEAEEERLEAKLLDLEDSIISSEEQTKAPEGDKLPIFTRLRDWTEHQRAEEEERRKERERKKKEEENGVPTRSASMPVPASSPIANIPKERRRRSDGQPPRPRGNVWDSRTVRMWDSPVFEEVDVPPRKPVPPPQTPPKIPINSSTPSLPIKPSPLKSSVQSNLLPAKKGPEAVREIRPVVPPKIPVHIGNYGYDAVSGPDASEYDGQRDPFFSVNIQLLGELLPAVLRVGHQNHDSISPVRDVHVRKKAKTVGRDESPHPHDKREHGKHCRHQKVHRDSRHGMRRRRDSAPNSLYVEVDSEAGGRHHKHCRKHRHRHRCRRHHLEEDRILHATEMPQIVWSGYYGEPIVWQRYDFV
ncbi:hypothetical protein TWF281_005242 [Arthrobotrys megalospora]